MGHVKLMHCQRAPQLQHDSPLDLCVITDPVSSCLKLSSNPLLGNIQCKAVSPQQDTARLPRGELHGLFKETISGTSSRQRL